MSSQEAKTYLQARGLEAGLRKQLDQANGRVAAAQARADLADQAFAASGNLARGNGWSSDGGCSISGVLGRLLGPSGPRASRR